MHKIETTYSNKTFISNLSDEDYKKFNHLVLLVGCVNYLEEKGLNHLSSKLASYRADSIRGLLVRNSDAVFEELEGRCWGWSKED